MTAAEIRDALALRWPDSEYLSIPEAPEDAARSGRKIDVLVFSLWRSRGFEREAIEIKVTYSDWTRERKAASKADFWWRHTNRFWLAVPASLAEKIKPELPAGWGLLSCATGACPKVIVQPTPHDAEPLREATVIGVMRAAADAGLNALRRAEERGRQAGREEGRLRAERASGDGVALAALEELRERISKFEDASGLDLSNPWTMGDVGEAVAIVRREMSHPGWAARNIGMAAEAAENQFDRAAAEAKRLKEAARSVTKALAAALEEAAHV